MRADEELLKPRHEVGRVAFGVGKSEEGRVLLPFAPNGSYWGVVGSNGNLHSRAITKPCDSRCEELTSIPASSVDSTLRPVGGGTVAVQDAPCLPNACLKRRRKRRRLE